MTQLGLFTMNGFNSNFHLTRVTDGAKYLNKSHIIFFFSIQIPLFKDLKMKGILTYGRVPHFVIRQKCTRQRQIIFTSL